MSSFIICEDDLHLLVFTGGLVALGATQIS